MERCLNQVILTLQNAMISAMIQLDKVLRQRVDRIVV